MNILIIEDEIPAFKQLQKLLQKARGNTKVLEHLDSIESSVAWFTKYGMLPDLIFMDIQLADGLSFQIFQEIDITKPIIFTTAFDQYMLHAFKVNSIDYLLKPIDPDDLSHALDKYEKFYSKQAPLDYSQLISAIKHPQKEYQQRFLIKAGQELRFIQTQNIGYFYSEQGLVFAVQNDGKKFNIDFTLEQLAEKLDPKFFFRINRKFIIHVSSIHRIHTYFNGRLKLDLKPDCSLDVIVSRDRVGDFKDWLNQ